MYVYMYIYSIYMPIFLSIVECGSCKTFNFSSTGGRYDPKSKVSSSPVSDSSPNFEEGSPGSLSILHNLFKAVRFSWDS